MTQNSFDVAVIGAGAAGLNAALILGQARRSVIVFDNGSPRNAAADHMLREAYAKVADTADENPIVHIENREIRAKEGIMGLATQKDDVVALSFSLKPHW